GFEVDPIEIDRGGLSFMVDTLGSLADRWRDAELFLLVGEDVLTTFERWRQPERVRELATLVVLTRAREPEAAELTREAGTVPASPGGELPGGEIPGGEIPGGEPRRLTTRRVDVSSTEVRARVGAGQSIRGFVPERVAGFI